MERTSLSSYVEALHAFLNDECVSKWIPSPLNSRTAFYTAADPVMLWNIPRETLPRSGVFKIYQCYEGYHLQTLLKADFYGALEAGYTIQRCEYCKRFFLCKDGRRTKYCDRPAPDDPTHTCAQLGDHFYRIKEAVGNSPQSQSLRRCRQRIDKDFARGKISVEERKRFYQKAKDLFHQAETRPGV